MEIQYIQEKKRDQTSTQNAFEKIDKQLGDFHQ